MSEHGRIDDYLDGALDGAAEEAFLTHLADCAACQAELHAAVQLRDREDALRATAAPAEAPVVSLATRRRRWVVPALATAAAAAAAVAVVASRGGGPRHAEAPATLALGPTRHVEARLAWAGAAGYRPYDALRAAGPAEVEAIDARAIAALEARGDCAGVAAAYLLSGELARAQTTYARCGDGPEVDADRAALALAQGQPAAALVAADRALAARAELPVARWNRALALRDLGLGLAAAAEFERAAADPAWAAEARQRAAAVRAPLDAQRTGYAEVVAAGKAMVAGGPPIAPALARAFPARARLRLDDAIRVATTRARLDELRPLAEALDGLAGDGLVARLAAARPTTAPAAVIAPYVAWVQVGAIADEAAWRRWRIDAERAGAHELVVGALLLATRGADDPALVARATGGGDPAWTGALAEVIAAGAAGDDARLAAVEARCVAGALPDYPCLRAALQRATVEFARYHVPATAAAAATAVRLAERTGEWAVRWRALYLAGNAARLRGDAALATAYYDETVVASDDCATTRVAATVAAELALADGRVADAAARARARPACGAPSLIELALEVELARAGAPARPPAAVTAALRELAPADPRDARYARYLAARVSLGVDPDAVQALQAIAAEPDTRGEPGRPDTGQLAAAVLAVEAARAGRWEQAVAGVAGRIGAPTPTACALAVAAELRRTVLVAVDARGGLVGVLDERARARALALPPPIASALGGCARVDVLALPPWLGAAVDVAPGVAWRFVTRRPVAAPAAPVHRVVVVDPQPPAALAIAPLAAAGNLPVDAEVLRGPAATVRRIAAAARDATLLEFHVHAARVVASDAPALIVSDDAGGYAATAEQIANWELRRAPVVLLADCDAGVGAGYGDLYWGLPRAFLDAGASAVVAALVPVPDGEGAEVFGALGDAIAGGADPAAAVAQLRAAKIARDPTSWVRDLVVFE